MNTTKTDNNLHLATFARLPIFDLKKNLWGYELVHIPGEREPESDLSFGDRVLPDLMSNTALAFDQTTVGKKNIMVNFSREHILEDLPYCLPPGRTAIKIQNPAGLSDPHLQALAKLKQDGYQVSMGWVKSHQMHKTIFGQTDIIRLDISNRVLPDLRDICRKAATYGALILADRVNDQIEFDICSRAGCTLFQGSFFKQPEPIAVKKIFPETISRFKLIRLIEQRDPDFSSIASAIQADVAISLRLFTYLNSASFGFRQKVSSVKEALTILGWPNLKTWLRVIIVSEISKNRHANELIILSAQRGKLLEQIGRVHDFWGFDPDTLFLLGIFSLLDALLNQPMTEVVKYLPLTDKLKDALCMAKNNEYVPLLKLAHHFEEATFDRSDAMINTLNLDPVKTNLAHRMAIDWAARLTI